MKRAKVPTAGFSLVELMVAMVIGLIVLGAATSLFVDSKKNYVVQDSLARLQENARFAMQKMVRDLRMAGYYGCADDITAITNTLNQSAAGGSYDTSDPIQGSESKSNWYPTASPAVAPPTTMRTGTDAFTVRYLDPGISTTIDSPFMPNTSAALHTPGGSGLAVGDIVFIHDCSAGAIFQITGPSDPNGGTIVHNTGGSTPGNSTKDLGKIFEGDAKISKYYYAMYYIAPSTTAGWSLYRQTVNSAGAQTEELAAGIEDLELLYGEDTTNGDKVPDVYRKASAVGNWDNVVSVRVGLLARTLANTDSGNTTHGAFLDTTTGYDVDGDGANETNFSAAQNDKYERRIFRNTVTLRNRQ